MSREIFGLILIILTANLAVADDYTKVMQREDAHACKYSHLQPDSSSRFSFERRELRTGLRQNQEMRLYANKYEIEAPYNMTSITLNRMVKAYKFEEAPLRKKLSELHYRRNSFERYAFLRLLVRQKAEHIMLGINESVNYLRGAPDQHPEATAREMGWLENRIYQSTIKDGVNGYRGLPVHAFQRIPSECTEGDSYLKELKDLLVKRRNLESVQKNYDPVSGKKYYPELPKNDRIYNLEKNKAVIGFQFKLRNAFNRIKEMNALKDQTNNETTKKLELFKYYMLSNSRLGQLQRYESTTARTNFIKNTPDFSSWRSYMLFLFSSSEERTVTIEKSQGDGLLLALAALPHGKKLRRSDWKLAFDSLVERNKEIDSGITMVQLEHPIMYLDFNQGIGTDTLHSWLASNPQELKPSRLNQYSATFDSEIQKALAVNFVNNQIPGLKRVCGILKMNPRHAICPERNPQLPGLILNDYNVNHLLKSEAQLSNSAYNMIIDYHVTGAKQLIHTGVEMVLLTVATMGVGTLAAVLSNGSKLAGIIHLSRVANLASKAHKGLQIWTATSKAAELARIGHTAFNLYLLSEAYKGTTMAYDTVLSSEEDAHSGILTPSWGTLDAAKSAWRSFYISAGLMALHGTLTKIQLSRFMRESVLVKNGVAYVKANAPARLVAALKAAKVEVKSFSSYQLLARTSDKTKLIGEAFTRTISRKGNFVDAGAKKGILQAELITDKASIHQRAISVLRVTKPTKGLSEGTAIIKDGQLAAGFEMVNKGGKLSFLHAESGEVFTLSNKIFSVANKSGEFAIKVKPGPAWFGVSQGIATPGGATKSTSYALLKRGAQIPMGALRQMGTLIGGGMKLAIGGTIVAAAGITLFMESSVNKSILRTAERIQEIIPANWEGLNETLNNLITRLRPGSINQVERKGKIREFTLQHHVRGVLDHFQNATNDLENRLNQMHTTKWYILDAIKELSKEEDPKRIEAFRGNLKNFLERQEYFIARFRSWKTQQQRNINYNAQWYTFYAENQKLFDRFWDEYHVNRRVNGLPNEFSKDCDEESCIMRYGMWIASYPFTGEKSSEMLEIETRVKELDQETQKLKQLVLVKYGIRTDKLPPEVQFSEIEIEQKTDVQKASAGGLVSYINSIESELVDKEVRLKHLVADFDLAFEKLASDHVTEVEKIVERDKALKILAGLYTLSMRDLYQWKHHCQKVLQVNLHEMLLLDAKDRQETIKEIHGISNGKISFHESINSDGEITLSVTSPHWHVGTESVDDKIAMKSFEVNFYQQLEQVQRKIHLLVELKIIDKLGQEELTNY
ncbi:MAG: hypothetical protein HN509_09790 [Halobacteriovoraceae bacterium]|jgi:hypothetical protein|nr:hypothetical protein [Halobacteriovoraceae bacterium]MBT5092744.1 hypothetical protein [Halobacteriovoraceae bacterium]